MKNLSTVWCLGSDPQPPERPYTKLQSCHCEEQSDLAIYAIEIASHSFAMTAINSNLLKATWY